MRRIAWCAVLVVGAGGCSSPPSAARASPSLIGQWKSVAFEGKDIVKSVKQVEFSFAADGAFTVKTTRQDAFGRVSETNEGTYEVNGDTLTVAVPGALPQEPARFSVQGDELIIEDSKLDSRVRFRRVAQPPE
jgi:uncharacterized protein (TIGR03066 family)